MHCLIWFGSAVRIVDSKGKIEEFVDYLLQGRRWGGFARLFCWSLLTSETVYVIYVCVKPVSIRPSLLAFVDRAESVQFFLISQRMLCLHSIGPSVWNNPNNRTSPQLRSINSETIMINTHKLCAWGRRWYVWSYPNPHQPPRRISRGLFGKKSLLVEQITVLQSVSSWNLPLRYISSAPLIISNTVHSNTWLNGTDIEDQAQADPHHRIQYPSGRTSFRTMMLSQLLNLSLRSALLLSLLERKEKKKKQLNKRTQILLSPI